MKTGAAILGSLVVTLLIADLCSADDPNLGRLWEDAVTATEKPPTVQELMADPQLQNLLDQSPGARQRIQQLHDRMMTAPITKLEKHSDTSADRWRGLLDDARKHAQATEKAASDLNLTGDKLIQANQQALEARIMLNGMHKLKDLEDAMAREALKTRKENAGLAEDLFGPSHESKPLEDKPVDEDAENAQLAEGLFGPLGDSDSTTEAAPPPQQPPAPAPPSPSAAAPTVPTENVTTIPPQQSPNNESSSRPPDAQDNGKADEGTGDTGAEGEGTGEAGGSAGDEAANADALLLLSIAAWARAERERENTQHGLSLEGQQEAARSGGSEDDWTGGGETTASYTEPGDGSTIPSELNVDAFRTAQEQQEARENAANQTVEPDRQEGRRLATALEQRRAAQQQAAQQRTQTSNNQSQYNNNTNQRSGRQGVANNNSRQQGRQRNGAAAGAAAGAAMRFLQQYGGGSH